MPSLLQKIIEQVEWLERRLTLFKNLKSDMYNLKLIACLRLDFSYLNERKFRHHFNDVINPMCNWGADIETGAQPDIFQDRGGLVKLGHFDKHFIKKSRRKAPQGKILEFFLLDTLKTTFWMANLTKRWTQSGNFFPKLEHSFWFSI